MNSESINVHMMTKSIDQFDSVIIGLGKTGISVVEFLAKREETFAVVDSRLQPPELKTLEQSYPQVPVYLGCLDENILCAARQLIVSPGVSLSDPAIRTAVEQGVNIVGDIELFCRQISTPIIGITGSNGKSTVVSLLNNMIKGAGKTVKLGGNIGTPVMDLISHEVPDFYVLELSSFQLETTSALNAVASVVLNVSADHMDRYNDMREYGLAKEKICNGNGVIVINLDDEIVAGFDKTGREHISFTLAEPKQGSFGIRMVSGKRWLAHGESLLLPAADLLIEGDHNLSNALAALALGTAIGLPVDSMLCTLREFSGLAHRCQWIANINGVDWYNDSKATNVGASCAAIKGLASKGKLILIAGGEGKNADFSPLSTASVGRVKACILIGHDANLLAKAIEDVVSVYFATDMNSAVLLAADLACEKDIVLLSPACASFDMFSDYQARGDSFTNSVCSLKGGGELMQRLRSRMPPQASRNIKLIEHYDFWLISVVIFLIFLGLVMVASSSITVADRIYNDPLHYFWRQAVAIILGLGFAILIIKTPLNLWQRLSLPVLLAGIFLLILVLVPGIGREVNGSMRWINLGPINIQSSEIVKICIIIYLAGYMVRHMEKVRDSFVGFICPIGVVTVVAGLLLLEPDYGSAAVLFATVLGMLFMGGVPLSRFFTWVVTASLVLISLAIISPYRLQRLTSFIDPWQDPFNSGFQLTQALIAFGRGDWFGIGLLVTASGTSALLA